MSLLFFDGFDQYSLWSDLYNYGEWYSCNGQPVPSTTVRTGTGKSLYINGSTCWVIKALSADQAGKTLYTGFAFARTGNGWGGCLLMVNNAINWTTPQCTLVLNAINKLELRLGAFNGTLLATSSITLLDQVFYYIEVKLLVAATGGIFEVRVNGTVVATYTGNTQGQANNSVVAIAFGSQNTNSGLGFLGYIDDVYVLNNAGSTNNTYLGEVRCQIMNPNADSAITWSRNAGTNNFGEINQTVGAQDGDTTYVYSSTSGQKDEYGLSDLTGIGTVAGVKLVTRAEKDDVNPLSLKHGIKVGTTDQQVTHVLGQSYGNFIDMFETADGVSTPFDATAINNLLSTIQLP